MPIPSLSILIPTYNGRALLQRCLASVCRFAPEGTQIVVVDDAGTDDTAERLKNEFPQVEYHRLPTNHGFCGAVNQGLAKVHGEVVELLNNDTEVTAGWAEPCLRHFADPSIGSVAPLAVQMDHPDIIDSAGQDYHICGWAYSRGFGRTIAMDDLVGRDVFGAVGSCGFYRLSAVRKLGGLWPVYGAYFEDTDLAFRLRWAGYRCRYEPAALVRHCGSATYSGQSNRQTYLISRNEEIAFWANLPLSTLLLGLVPHLGFLAVRALRKTMSGQARVFLAGKLSALSNGRAIREQRRIVRSLAEEGRRPLHFALSNHGRIIQQGIDWLRHRHCA